MSNTNNQTTNKKSNQGAENAKKPKNEGNRNRSSNSSNRSGSSTGSNPGSNRYRQAGNTQRSNAVLHKRDEFINRIRKILSWDFGIKLPEDMRGFHDKIVTILSSPKYGNMDPNKTRLETFLDSCTTKQMIQIQTYIRLQDKLEDEVNVIKSDKEIVKEFKMNQSKISYIENSVVDKLRSTFCAKVPIDLESNNVVQNEEIPYLLTSGVNFHKQAFPRIDGCPAMLNEKLLIIEHGCLNANIPLYLRNASAKLQEQGGVFAGMLAMVPKSYKTKRTIGIATAEAVAEQLPYNTALRKASTKNNKDQRSVVSYARQHVQQMRVLTNGNHTIDLSNASDLVSLDLIKRLHPKLGDIISDTTPRFVNSAHGRVEVKCCGLQGYPLTFSVMAILVNSIIEEFTDCTTYVSNYGDDIIVDGEFEQVVAALQLFGLEVNTRKSFDTSVSYYSESCGVDSLRDRFIPRFRHDITPVYLRKVNDTSLIAFINNCIKKDLLSKKQVLDLANLATTFFIYPWSYQTSEFHINYDLYEGDERNQHMKIVQKGFVKPKIVTLFDSPHIKAPLIVSKLGSIYGFTKSESQFIIECIDLWESIKTYGVKYDKWEFDNSYTVVDLSQHKYFFIIKKCDGSNCTDVFSEDAEQIFIRELGFRDFKRVYTFISVMLSEARFFTGSFENFDPNDYDEILHSNEFRHEFLDGVNIRENVTLPIGKMIPQKTFGYLPIPKHYSF